MASLRRMLACISAVLTAVATAHAQSCPSLPEPPPVRLESSLVPPGMRIGLALGSGSMHGLVHIGVLQGIEESGLPVRVVAGTSVGALVGSLWASGLPAARIAALERSGEFENLNVFAPASGGLLSNKPLRSELEKIFDRRPIETWPIRFGAVATNADNGQRRILVTGSGAIAVQASSASPVMFGPVTVNGERLADGALAEPVPVDAARAMGADFVIAVDVLYRPHEEPAEGIVQSGFQALNILVNNLAAAQSRDADIALHLDVHETLMKCGNEAVIALGRDAMRRAMPQVERALRARGAQHQAAR